MFKMWRKMGKRSKFPHLNVLMQTSYGFVQHRYGCMSFLHVCVSFCVPFCQLLHYFSIVHKVSRWYKSIHTGVWMPIRLLGISHNLIHDHVIASVPPKCLIMVYTPIQRAVYISMRISSYVFCRKTQKQPFYN